MKLNDMKFIEDRRLSRNPGLSSEVVQKMKESYPILAQYYKHDYVNVLSISYVDPERIINSQSFQLIDAWWDSDKRLKLIANQYFVTSDKDSCYGGFLLLIYGDKEEVTTNE